MLAMVDWAEPTFDVDDADGVARTRSRSHHKVFLGLLGVSAAALAGVAPAAAQDAWPAEKVGKAVNLTHIEGRLENDFHFDLSGAVWNPVTRTLWVCRNGPELRTSKFWAVVEQGADSFEIDYRDGNRGEWTSFGDVEGITQADFTEDVVYLVIEGDVSLPNEKERIEEYDVSTYGIAILENEWDLTMIRDLPPTGNDGPEGITFVPDAFLAAAGFVDSNGLPYTSTLGMGGLMFVGHQNGGHIYVLDLDRTAEGSTFRGTSGYAFVGKYETSFNETAGLEFDRSTGLLYVWHDASHDILETLDLTSSEVAGRSERRFNTVGLFDGPNDMNVKNEGIALMPQQDCVGDNRSFFMTVDDGNFDSLFWYRKFTDGCPPPICVILALDAAPGEPLLTIGAGACPPSGTLARAIDLIRGDLAGVSAVGSTIDLGPVVPIACGATDETYLVDDPTPVPGGVFFYLAREADFSAYGLSSDSSPRLAGHGDCN